MKWRLVVGGCIGAALLTPPLAAQEREGWTLVRLLEHARASEPAILTSRLEVAVMDAEARQAALWSNPRVDIEHRQVPGGMDRQTMATVEWPLELFRRGPRAAAARAAVAVASAMADDRERMLLLDVHMAYSNHLGATRRLTVLDELLVESRRTIALLDSRAAAGAIPRLERDQASIEASRIEAAHAVAAGAVERTRAELRRSIGLPRDTAMTLAQTLDTAVPWAEIDAALLGSPHASAVDDRPDVRAAVAQVHSETARLEQARSEGRFDVALYGGYMRMTSGFPQFGLDASGARVPIEETFNMLVAGAVIDLPIFNRNQGAATAAGLRADAARKTVEARRLAAAAERDGAQARLRAAAAAARAFTRQVRETARRNVEVVREAYALGRHTLLEVIMEQQRYLELEMAYTEALIELLDAHAAWQAAIGRHQ